MNNGLSLIGISSSTFADVTHWTTNFRSAMLDVTVRRFVMLDFSPRGEQLLFFPNGDSTKDCK